MAISQSFKDSLGHRVTFGYNQRQLRVSRKSKQMIMNFIFSTLAYKIDDGFLNY